MKGSFKFAEVDKRLNKKTKKEVQQQKMRQNFLRIYDDNPLNDHLQKFCQDTKNLFDEVRKNNRYYTYKFNKVQEEKSSQLLRTQQIKKLNNYKMPYKTEQINKIQQTQSEKQIRFQKIRKLNVKRSFRYQIKVIINKMKKANLSLQDIISKQIFSKSPYKFGSQIFTAVKQGSLQKVWRCISQNKYSVYSIDNTGKTPLFWACIRGHENVIRMLIDVGVDINKKDIHGLTPLNYAIQYNQSQCVRLLMLHMSAYNDSHQKDSNNALQKVRRIFQLAVKLGQNFQKLDLSKREKLFDQQYNYLYR